MLPTKALKLLLWIVAALIAIAHIADSALPAQAIFFDTITNGITGAIALIPGAGSFANAINGGLKVIAYVLFGVIGIYGLTRKNSEEEEKAKMWIPIRHHYVALRTCLNMPVYNQPIESNRSLGKMKLVAGIFSPTMVPGLILAVIIGSVSMQVTHTLWKRKELGILPGVSILAAYYFGIGANEEKAWKNITRWIPQKKLYLSSGKNVDIFRKTVS
jgi:hypothetical protein